MTTAKHTPGPWAAEGGTYIPITADTPKGHAQIGRAESYGHISSEEREANSRLMAAAPDLFAACKVAQSVIEWMIDHEPAALERAGVAIDGGGAYAWRLANLGIEAIALAEGGGLTDVPPAPTRLVQP